MEITLIYCVQLDCFLLCHCVALQNINIGSFASIIGTYSLRQLIVVSFYIECKLSMVLNSIGEFVRTFSGWDEGVMGMQVGEVARLTVIL